MAPFELKNLTYKQLVETRKAMAQPEYLWGVMKLPPEVQRKNAWLNHLIQLAILQLREAELSLIRDKLAANETDLNDGIIRVQGILADLSKTGEIITQVNSFLTIVGRIVPLLV